MISISSIGIAVFCYNKPNHIKIVLDKLLSIPKSSALNIYVFSDGYRDLADIDGVTKVRSHFSKYTNN